MTAQGVPAGAKFQSNHTSDVEPVQQVRGGHRRVLGDGDHMMLVEWRFEPGATVPEHAHPHEQSGYVISGTMLFKIEGDEREVPMGTGYLIPSGVPHSARFEEFTVLVDVFSPPREDYRESSADAPSYMLGTMPLASAAERDNPAARSAAVRQRTGKIDTVITAANSEPATKNTKLKRTSAKIKPPTTPRKSSARTSKRTSTRGKSKRR